MSADPTAAQRKEPAMTSTRLPRHQHRILVRALRRLANTPRPAHPISGGTFAIF
jgi:hypothetical protein